MNEVLKTVMGSSAPSVAQIDRAIEAVRTHFDLPAPEVPFDPAGLRAQVILDEIARDPEAWDTFIEWRRMRREETDAVRRE